MKYHSLEINTRIYLRECQTFNIELRIEWYNYIVDNCFWCFQLYHVLIISGIIRLKCLCYTSVTLRAYSFNFDEEITF